MSNVKTLVVGDIHGCVDELKELLHLMDYRQGNDELYILGDLVDRGPDSAGVVRYCRMIGAKGVMGNHDLKNIEFRKRNKAPKKHLAELSDADWKYLEELAPFYWLDSNWLLVHAGFTADKAFYAQPLDTVCRVRWLDQHGRHTGSADPTAGVVHWAKKWTGPQNVAYGHFVHDLKDVKIDEPVPGVFCYGLDTGCVFNGRLSGMVLETKEIVQVAAKRDYGNAWRGANANVSEE